MMRWWATVVSSGY